MKFSGISIVFAIVCHSSDIFCSGLEKGKLQYILLLSSNHNQESVPSLKVKGKLIYILSYGDFEGWERPRSSSVTNACERLTPPSLDRMFDSHSRGANTPVLQFRESKAVLRLKLSSSEPLLISRIYIYACSNAEANGSDYVRLVHTGFDGSPQVFAMTKITNTYGKFKQFSLTMKGIVPRDMRGNADDKYRIDILSETGKCKVGPVLASKDIDHAQLFKTEAGSKEVR